MAPPSFSTSASGIVPDAAVPAAPGATDATLSDAIDTLRKRKWLILAAVLLGIVYGLYKGATQVPVYIASGTIEIRSGSSNEYRLSTATGVDSSSHMASEVAILKSGSLLLRVATDLDLANNAGFLGAKGPLPHFDIEDPNVRQNMIDRLGNGLTVSSIPKTDIIRIDVASLHPELSAQIVNRLIDDYIHRSSQVRIDFSKRVSDELTPQLDDLKERVELSQEKVIELQKRIGVLGFDPSHNQINSILEDLTRASSAAEINRIVAESRYHVLTQMDQEAIDSSVDSALGGVIASGNSSLGSLRFELATDRVQYAQLMEYMLPKNPVAVAMQNQMDQLQKEITTEQDRLITQSKETYVAARNSEQQTNSALDSQKQEAYKLRDDIVAYGLAQRDFDSNRTLYEGLQQKLRTAAISAGLESNEIDVVDHAYPPVHANLQRRSNLAMLSGLSALVIGIILSFILEALDTSLSSVTELETVTGLPSLALIPRARRDVAREGASMVQRNLAVLSRPKSQFAESFRALRTSLLLSTAGHPPNIILLTSATPSEGKTTISVNLACVLAQRDVRVLLIDGDLRRPAIHHRLGLNGKSGLTSVLTGSATLEQAVQRVPEIPNLDILTSGPVPPFPTEMLGSDSMQSLLEHCRSVYTHVVIDSPPLLSVTDGVVLSRSSDAVVMIVRHGKSNKNVVRRARDLIVRAGGHMTGLVLNAVDLSSPEYYGYYGYYGYSGYSYAGADSANWKAETDNPDGQTKSTPTDPTNGGAR